jgi:Fe-S-cluster containining protein
MYFPLIIHDFEFHLISRYIFKHISFFYLNLRRARMDNLKAEEIANRARGSISKICIEECKALCCRKGFLILEKGQVDIVTQNKAQELKKEGALREQKDGTISLNLANHQGSCPSLKENKCTIYTDPARPKACHQFPIFIRNDTVSLSPRCLAVKMNAFYSFEKEWLRLGYKLEKRPLYDSDFFVNI